MMEIITSHVSRVGGDSWRCNDLAALSAAGDCNVYLLRLNNANILIDAATLPGQSAIESNIKECGVEPRDLSALILTHSHYDHTQAAHYWQNAYTVPTYLNSVGAAFLRRDDLRLVGHQSLGPEYVFEPFRVDHACEDAETFEMGSARVTSLHMPGHTPDSTLFIAEYDGVRVGFCGDIAFSPPPGSSGEIGWLSLLWLSDLSLYQKSLNRFLTVDLDILLPGHGHPLVGKPSIQQALEMSAASVKRLRASPDAHHFGIAL
jgi:glyoxylase-like metal-dependent hydrolase (beta-lactamase superfamily II)